MKQNIWGLINNLRRGKKQEREGMLDMLSDTMMQIKERYPKLKTAEDKAAFLDELVDFLCINN